MPSKKRKYNARFPAGRIKKIMQSDEDVGKIAQAVPVIISRTLELFVESLLTKSLKITNVRNAKTLSPSHLKQCIHSESRFDFLKDLVKNIPDIGVDEGSSIIATDDQSAAASSSSGYKDLLEANGSQHRMLQRSQSLQQPSTSQHIQQQQQQFYLNNYTNLPNSHKQPNSLGDGSLLHRPPPAKMVRINSSPASATITSEQLKQLPAPLNFPIQISYNIDNPIAGSSQTPAVVPAVKIDYSKFNLPATSPSIKIDLSSYTQQVTTTPVPPTGLDEDYDV